MPLRNLESHFHLYQQWIKLAYQRILEIESFASVSRYSLYIMHHLQIADGLVWALVSFPGTIASESLSMRCLVNFGSFPAFHFKMVLFCKKRTALHIFAGNIKAGRPNGCCSVMIGGNEMLNNVSVQFSLIFNALIQVRLTFCRFCTRGGQFYVNFMLMRAGKITPSYFMSTLEINTSKEKYTLQKSIFWVVWIVVPGSLSCATP